MWTLEECVQRLAAHAARRFGLKNRGLLREGLAIWEKSPRDDWHRYEVMSLLG